MSITDVYAILRVLAAYTVHSFVQTRLLSTYSLDAHAMSFVDAWKEVIWPQVDKKYQELLNQRPAKQETATWGTFWGKGVRGPRGEEGSPKCCLQSRRDTPNKEHKPPE